MTARYKLTPQMVEYERQFADDGDIRWLPYLMYFHPANHRSQTVNTDRCGFRYSQHAGVKYSVADHDNESAMRLLAGSSTVFGIGASADRWTLSSQLSENDPRQLKWLNFGGRSFNSAQEILLFVLYGHMMPKLKEIVLFSGFNNLGLARQPSRNRMEHGAFFNCDWFFDALGRESAISPKKGWSFLPFSDKSEAEAPLGIGEQIQFATDLTSRHLDVWRMLAAQLEAKITFVLQPLAGWVRPKGCAEEEELFKELDRAGNFSDAYGDILHREICEEYAAQLSPKAREMGVNFINLAPIMAECIKPEQWIFADRIHFTDQGHNLVSKILLDIL